MQNPNNTKLTFVTSFLNFYHTPLHPKTIDLRLSRFRPILEIGIAMVVYVSPDLVSVFEAYVHKHFPNNEHIRMVPLQKSLFESSYAYLIAKQWKLALPKSRHMAKDTLEYMCYSHSKIGFLHHVSELNPFQSTHFAWIDYDISTMWKNVKYQQRVLQNMGHHGIRTDLHQLPSTETASGREMHIDDELYVPVCSDVPSIPYDIEKDLCDRVCWRFCTNFFVGTSVSLKHLYDLYTQYYEVFLSTTKTMIWDMNFWLYLEQFHQWNPITYRANHDDTMIQDFPLFALASPLKPASSSPMSSSHMSHLYPLVPFYSSSDKQAAPYYPSSSSYVTRTHPETREKETWLNVRYVNYFYMPSGHCTYGTPIQCFNALYRLRDANENIKPYTIELPDHPYEVIATPTSMGLPEPNPNELFQGIEDIRLFMHEQRLKFMATTVNYSGCGQARMLYGDYRIDTHEKKAYLEQVRVFYESPVQDPKKEKNWIPFVPELQPDKLYVIYRWSNPFQMGTIEDSRENPQAASWKVRYTYPVQFPYKEEIRGSTNVVYDMTTKMYVAMVHLSVEDTLPKQYYHMLVWLDPETYCPRKCSKLVYFVQMGVEFCLSMDVQEDEYVFWVSCMDRDPRMIRIPKSHFIGESGNEWWSL